MKKLVLLLTVISVLTYSCTEDECTNTYVYQSYTPVYKTLEEISTEIKYEAQRVLENPGKIYFYDNLILINEREQGIHIIDNQNPTNPIKKGFLSIPGNIDISMTSHYIYADMQFNVIIIDILDMTAPKVVNVITQIKEEIFPSEDQGKYLYRVEIGEVTESFSCDGGYPGIYYLQDNVAFVDRAASQGALTNSSIPDFNQNGIGGSLSRMALFDDHFYYVNNFAMYIFDASRPENPDRLNEVYMQWGVETIFPYKDNLFIGANNGMHIFDNSDKSNPQFLSTFQHARACDPVAVEGNTAFVTLRDGTECESFTNQLDVVDITSLKEPQLIASYRMHHPIGLSVRNNILYLCDDDQGLKIFDVSNLEEVDRNFLGGVKDYQSYDVISVTDRLLLMIGADGFYQFDVTDPRQPKLLSSIKKGA